MGDLSTINLQFFASADLLAEGFATGAIVQAETEAWATLETVDAFVGAQDAQHTTLPQLISAYKQAYVFGKRDHLKKLGPVIAEAIREQALAWNRLLPKMISRPHKAPTQFLATRKAVFQCQLGMEGGFSSAPRLAKSGTGAPGGGDARIDDHPRGIEITPFPISIKRYSIYIDDPRAKDDPPSAFHLVGDLAKDGIVDHDGFGFVIIRNGQGAIKGSGYSYCSRVSIVDTENRIAVDSHLPIWYDDYSVFESDLQALLTRLRSMGLNFEKARVTVVYGKEEWDRPTPPPGLEIPEILNRNGLIVNTVLSAQDAHQLFLLDLDTGNVEKVEREEPIKPDVLNPVIVFTRQPTRVLYTPEGTLEGAPPESREVWLQKATVDALAQAGEWPVLRERLVKMIALQRQHALDKTQADQTFLQAMQTRADRLADQVNATQWMTIVRELLVASQK